jgi:hypothetical protein
MRARPPAPLSKKLRPGETEFARSKMQEWCHNAAGEMSLSGTEAGRASYGFGPPGVLPADAWYCASARGRAGLGEALRGVVEP